MKGSETEMLKDPVCGMEIEERDSVIRRNHNGRTYFFCSFSCREVFDENPRKYSEKKNDASLTHGPDPWLSAANFNR